MSRRNLSNIPDPGVEDGDQINIPGMTIGRLEPAEGFSSFAGYWSHVFRDQRNSAFETRQYKHGRARDKERVVGRSPSHLDFNAELSSRDDQARYQDKDKDAMVVDDLSGDQADISATFKVSLHSEESDDRKKELNTGASMHTPKEPSNPRQQQNVTSVWFPDATGFQFNNSVMNNYAIGKHFNLV
ncbi:hypothetical protein D9758_018108 [Tetrapyrgos nigripes]|uniref:Uncharacterized protein n=1 Tax=Tetrapyrgos nigripes TaxID=182062 RepID=A0A8H5F4G1_9AGAR|nr:hypothetical protein D9758_018108 [Tetrapyrgos nigripes]